MLVADGMDEYVLGEAYPGKGRKHEGKSDSRDLHFDALKVTSKYGYVELKVWKKLGDSDTGRKRCRKRRIEIRDERRDDTFYVYSEPLRIFRFYSIITPRSPR